MTDSNIQENQFLEAYPNSNIAAIHRWLQREGLNPPYCYPDLWRAAEAVKMQTHE